MLDGANSKIHIINISSPGAPTYDSGWIDVGIVTPNFIAGKSGWLFVSDGGGVGPGVKVIDVSTPDSPSLNNTWTGSTLPRALELSNDGNTLAVVTGGSPATIFLVDVSDPTSPSSITEITEDYANQFFSLVDMVFSGDDGWLYITTSNEGAFDEHTVSVLDIRTLASPVWVNQKAESLIDFDDVDDTVTLRAMSIQPEDKTLYSFGSSVDHPGGGPGTRGAAFKIVNHRHLFRFIDYPPAGTESVGTIAYKMVRVPPYPSTYGVGMVVDENNDLGAQVFKLRHTFQLSVSHFINAIEMTIDKEGVMSCSWTLAPSLAEQFWVLGVPGFSELGITTRLAWGEI